MYGLLIIYDTIIQLESMTKRIFNTINYKCHLQIKGYSCVQNTEKEINVQSQLFKISN